MVQYRKSANVIHYMNKYMEIPQVYFIRFRKNLANPTFLCNEMSDKIKDTRDIIKHKR